MKQHILTLLCSVIVVISAIPLPADEQELHVLQIPLSNGKELDVLSLGAKDQEQMIADRNKRTIGLLRELFPDITKQVDDQVNRIISKLLRTLGPTILRTAVQGNTANRARSSFDADFDDDDDDDESSSGSSSSGGGATGSSSRVQIELPTFSPDVDDDFDKDNEVDSDKNTSTTESSRK